MRNTLVMTVVEYAKNIIDSTAPLSAEYSTNSTVAVDNDRRPIRAEIYHTSANSAMMMPQNATLEPNIMYASDGVLATPKATMPVMTNANAIHRYTLRMSVGNASDTKPSRSSIIL